MKEIIDRIGFWLVVLILLIAPIVMVGFYNGVGGWFVLYIVLLMFADSIKLRKYTEDDSNDT